MRCIRIGMLLPTLGKHVLLVRLQHWKLADFLEVARKSARSTYDRRKCFGCHCVPQSAPAISADCSLFAYRVAGLKTIGPHPTLCAKLVASEAIASCRSSVQGTLLCTRGNAHSRHSA